MFDRINLINLDKRVDRIGSFKAKIAEIPLLKDFTRVRAIHGDTVTVPGYFTSGGGAWGCRCSHVRVLEDAMLDGVETLLVLEDDVRFCPDFTAKLLEFMRRVPNDWDGLMLGGQPHSPFSAPTELPGIFKTRNTQRTHAYAVRGMKPMQDLYRLWSRADRHIDHLFGQWQQKWNVYEPQPFLCGQDETVSDISGRNDAVRYWNPQLEQDLEKHPIILLETHREVAEGLRAVGFHFGDSRDPVTGKDRGLMQMARNQYPVDDVKAWCDLIVHEAIDRGGIPGIWHMPDITEGFLRAKIDRPVKVVKTDSIVGGVNQIPELLRAWTASQIVWCWRGQGVEFLEGMKYHGWHRGYSVDDVTGLDNGVRRAYGEAGRTGLLRTVYNQLKKEIGTIRYGKVLIAHPELRAGDVRDAIGGDVRVFELVGKDIGEVIADYHRQLDGALEMYHGELVKQ